MGIGSWQVFSDHIQILSFLKRAGPQRLNMGSAKSKLGSELEIMQTRPGQVV